MKTGLMTPLPRLRSVIKRGNSNHNWMRAHLFKRPLPSLRPYFPILSHISTSGHFYFFTEHKISGNNKGCLISEWSLPWCCRSPPRMCLYLRISIYCKYNSPMNPHVRCCWSVDPSVGRLVDQSVIMSKREVKIPCSYRSFSLCISLLVM